MSQHHPTAPPGHPDPAFLQFSAKAAFGAQAAVGTGFGYLGQGAGMLLSKRRAYSLYQYAALRLGQQAAYPVWQGSAHLSRTAVPAGLGVVEEHLENQAQERWPLPDSTDTITGPKPPIR